jgi:hypothetical protein
MNMIKKIGTLTLAAAACLFFWGCPKPDPSPAPEPDTETDRAVDVAWATFVVTDIDMIASHLGEEDLFPKFYMQIPGTETAGGTAGTVSCQRDPTPGAKTMNINFNKAKCMDGRFREGEIRMDFDYAVLNVKGGNPNSQYYHEYGYGCRVSLNQYKVDGWIIDEYDPQFPGYIYNELTGPKTGQFRWRIAGKYAMVHPSDNKKNIVWDGLIFKTLLLPEDPIQQKKVLDYTRPQGRPVITWSNSVVSYSGTIKGKTDVVRDTLSLSPPVGSFSGGIDYGVNILENSQLVRDFSCYPDKVASVSVAPGTNNTFSLLLRYEEYHPFVKGIASFTTGEKYPRQIYFGNEGGDLEQQCDNTGEVLIKGISYRVNFRK